MIKSNKNNVKDKEEAEKKVDINIDLEDENSSESNSDEATTDSSDNNAQETDEKKNSGDLKAKDKEIASLTDMLKRRQADFENYKKRIAKNQEEYKKLAIKDFAFDIININDDFLRAIDAASDVSDEQTKAFADGIRIISKRIEETLEKYGIEEIDSLNKEFDPKFNEAVEIDMGEDVDSDTITAVYQKGFKLDDYVIRCAKVKVTKPMVVNSNDSSEEKDKKAEGCGCCNHNEEENSSEDK